LKKRGQDMAKLRGVIDALLSHEPLPASFRDHGLRGEWEGCRNCHVAPDWVLIYERGESVLTLYPTGTHADLFE
jgi:mRNA interferase YafQ